MRSERMIPSEIALLICTTREALAAQGITTATIAVNAWRKKGTTGMYALLWVSRPHSTHKSALWKD
jgi:hypothetical protein